MSRILAKKFRNMLLALFTVFSLAILANQPIHAATDSEPPHVDFSSLTVTLPGGGDSVSFGGTVHISIKVTDDSDFQYSNCCITYKVPGATYYKRVYMEKNGYNKETGLWEQDIVINEETLLPGLYQISGMIFGDIHDNNTQVWNSAIFSDDRALVDLSAGDFLLTAACTGHQWEEEIQKATPDSNGRIYRKCTVCEAEETLATLLKVSNISLEGTSYSYTGKAIEPKVTVANTSEALAEDQYKVEYSNNVNPGTAKVKVTLANKWYEGTKTLTFTIKGEAKANPMSVKGKTVKLSIKKVKQKKQVIAAKNAIAVKDAKGAVTYKLVSVTKSKFKKNFSVNAKTGKITVKKGTKKGTYTLKIKVSAAGDALYKAGDKTVKVKIVIK